MNTVELLAPAGDFQTALFAFEAGADAVYCGLADFSARAFATNFSFEDLEQLMAYARKRDKKVYVTFNTLLDEDQFDSAIETLARLEDVRPDGVIVQDLGVAKLIHDHFPNLPLHASTQLVAHNLEGVLALGELGFTRVVLARELSIEEVASVAKRCGDIELEVFIHGALCYSLSGLCLFGAMEKGRSGNRGKCPYCCRQAYEIKAKGSGEEEAKDEGEVRNSRFCSVATMEDNHHSSPSPSSTPTPSPSPSPSSFASSPVYPFSMKDLRLGDDVKKLVDAGVASLKIEGRMKSPLYVASVTKYYRQILDKSEGRSAKGEVRRAISVSDLETVFSRRTTELYLNGRPSERVIDTESLGHLGAPVGVVKKVTRDREGRAWLRFHTCRGLEKHDGLQFDAMTDEGRHLGMGIVEMRQAISRRPVFEVNAGVDVEVLVNEEVERALRPGMNVYCSMSNAVKRLFPTPSFRPSDYHEGMYGLDIALTIARDRVTAAVDGVDQVPKAEVTGSFGPAKHPEKTREAAEKAFSKLGGTGYWLSGLSVSDSEKLFVPTSLLNDLRRDLVEAMNAWRERASHEKIEAAKGESFEPCGGPRERGPYGLSRRVKIRAGQTLPAGEWNEVIVAINPETDVDNVSSFITHHSSLIVRLATPVYTSELAFNKLRSAVKRFLRAGFDKWEASDLATLRMLKELGVTDITADWTLYAFNARALAQVAALGVKRLVASPENGRENLQYLAESGYDVEFLTQQSTPLFVSLTEPATTTPGESLRVFVRDGLWVTTKRMPRTFDIPEGVSTRIDLSWDPE